MRAAHHFSDDAGDDAGDGAGDGGAPDAADREPGPLVDLREIVVEHNAQIFRYARTFTRCDADAEDLAQTALVRALQRGPLHCSPDQAKWYVLQTVRNLAIDEARARARMRVEPHAVVPDGESPDELPDDAVVRAFDEPLTRSVLDRLAAHHRDVLHLRFFDELGYDVMAERLDVSEQAARQRVYRAVRALRRAALRLRPS
jgi:RNA polymerase sigma-70 factor (ECF subfamily)